MDGGGNVTVAGTSSFTWGSPARAFGGGDDAYAATLDSSGALAWNTFLGGTGNDGGNALAVDGSGNLYMAGYSSATWGSPVGAYSASTDIFVAQIQTKQTQTLSFGTAPTVAYNGTGTVTATASSGLAVTYSSQTPAACSVNSGSGLVTGLAAGSNNCTIAANQAGDATYAAAPQVTQTFSIGKASPSVTTWPTATAITYGQTLASSSLSGGSASPAGSFAFTTPSTAPSAGTAAQGVTFTPTDTANYNTASSTVNVTVNQATPSVTTWPTATAITYGQTLASSSLSGGSANTAGSFAFTTPSTAPGAGTAAQGVTFTPTDTANYTTATGTANVTVSKASQSISFGAAPSVLTGGTGTVSATASSGLAVTFSSTTPSVCTVSGGTVTGVQAGSCTIAANQAGDANYNAATQATQSFTIAKDTDHDGIADRFDNCPTVSNAGQADSNADGRGDACPVYYVNVAAAAGGNGLSWATAFNTLQDALTYGQTGGGETWVAKGVYYPDLSGAGDSNDPAASFTVPDKLHLYGGFAGTETLASQRNGWANRTILSGDIGQDDVNTDGNYLAEGYADLHGTNSLHVVSTGAVSAATVVEGFFVTAGNANGAGVDANGGGWLNQGGAPTLSRLFFIGNRAVGSGGGLQSASGDVTLLNSAFTGNQATAGGALAASASNLVLANVTISGNDGGAVAADAGAWTVRNAILWDDAGSEIRRDNGAAAAIDHSVVQGSGGSGAGWDAAFGSDGGGNQATDPKLLAADKGDVRLADSGSSALNAGDNAAAAGQAVDLGGQPRLQDGTVDIGAMEYHPVAQTTAASVAGTSTSDILTLKPTNTTVSAGTGDDVVISASGRQTLTFGAGRDVVVWGVYPDSDIVNDFVAGEDRLDLRKALTAIGYAGGNALGGGYVVCADTTSGVSLKLDKDGSAGSAYAPVSYALVKGAGLTAAALCQPINLLY